MTIPGPAYAVDLDVSNLAMRKGRDGHSAAAAVRNAGIAGDGSRLSGVETVIVWEVVSISSNRQN